MFNKKIYKIAVVTILTLLIVLGVSCSGDNAKVDGKGEEKKVHINISLELNNIHHEDKTITIEQGSCLPESIWNDYKGKDEDGSRFVGFYTTQNGEGEEEKKYLGPIDKNTSFFTDQTIFAYWLAAEDSEKVVVSFNLNGLGEEIESKVIDKGTATEGIIPTPSTEGYTFKGWYLDRDPEKVYYSTYSFEEDTILYASWSINTYALTLNFNNGSENQETEIKYNQSFVSLNVPNPVRDGYNFIGWYTDNNYNKESKVSDETTFKDNSQLYARWAKSTCTLTFNTNSGSAVSSVDIEGGEKFSTVSSSIVTPSKANYDFTGWYINSNLTRRVSADDTFLDSATLYAGWQGKLMPVRMYRYDKTGQLENSWTTSFRYGVTYGAAWIGSTEWHTDYYLDSKKLSRVTGSTVFTGAPELHIFEK